MRASALLRSRDETSFNSEVERGEDGSLAIGQDVSLGDLGDASMVGGRSGSMVSGGAAETEGQLQLPSLEGGKKASSLINPYMQAALQRATKLGDALAKLRAVPPSEQTDAIKKMLSKMESTQNALEACQDAMQEIYCAGAVEGYSREPSSSTSVMPRQEDELIKQYKPMQEHPRTQGHRIFGFRDQIQSCYAETPSCAGPGPTARELIHALGNGATWPHAPAARIVRLAKAIEEEQPGILGGIRLISKLDLPKGEQCIPYMLFGDEGRSLRKSPIQIVCLETVFGQGTFDNYEELCKQGKQVDARAMLGTMVHTGKGSSFLSRLLLYALPHALYRSDSDVSYKQFWYDCMDQVARAAIRVFEEGIPHRLGTFYGVCVGFKGDAPFLAKAAKLGRTFMSVGGHNKGICPYCEVLTYPGKMWGQEYSAVRSIPFTTASPEQLLQPDLFHTVKLGIARHFAGSFLVLVAHWGYFFEAGKNSFPDVLARMYTDFKAACAEMRLTPNIKGFTKDTFHFSNFESWPWAGWKGSDTLLVLRWMIMLLRHGCWSGGARRSPWLQHPREADHGPVFKAVHDGCCAILTLFQVAQKQGIWLHRNWAVRLHSSIDLFCSSYKYLAGLFFTRGLNRFHLEPTLHQLKHFSIRIQEQLANEDVEVIQNPGMYICEMSEDFVGHVSRVSRRVAARSCGLRTLQRHLIRVHMFWAAKNRSS
ncbi:unnamed protein product [Symbiodinium necroappetens]|uniref:Uncharacterized protein n=1 Tax=Symbiodinium necroappetens TaxID=1628268 RepID=A0A812J3V6_9DINO|nr:unnamed protein product [Symbiodinium necroappetens]